MISQVSQIKNPLNKSNGDLLRGEKQPAWFLFFSHNHYVHALQHGVWQCLQWVLSGISLSGGGCWRRLSQLLHQRFLKKNNWLWSVSVLAIIACNSCVINQQAQQQRDVFVAQQAPKREPPPINDFIAPNAIPELCSSDIQSHTIGNQLYWISQDIDSAEIQQGLASWYGGTFHGRRTANGEIYNMYALSAAHKSLPMSSLAIVTNLKNNKFVVVRINDRGPFYKQRIIDLSYAAAHQINMVKDGVVFVRVWPIGMPVQEESLLNYFSWSTDKQLSRAGYTE